MKTRVFNLIILVEATACCDSMPAPMAQKMRRKMAQDDKLFNDDDL